MFSFPKIARNYLGAILLSSLIATPAFAELSLEEINSVARQTTVLIAPGLTPELIKELEENRNNPLARANNPDGVWNPGSGVIIGRQGNTYYVLSVTHNFKEKDLELNVPYGIRTSDGIVHAITDVNDGRDCPLQGTPSLRRLLRFGCYSLNVPGRVAGPDLAVVSFTSEKEYPIASLGDVNSIKVGDRVYVSGWPDPEKEKDAVTGECRGKVARRQRRLAWGPVTSKIQPNQSENGYSIFYVDLTRPGMSGGPVFDSNGYVVGVHGRGSADKGKLVSQYCSVSKVENNLGLESEDVEKITLEAESYDPPRLHTRFSSAQNGNNFLSLWGQLKVNVLFNQSPPAREFIGAGLIPIETNASESGSVDVLAREDVTGQVEFNNSQDVVEDIYEGFSLKNMLRDEPSAGCEFLLLGEPCK